MILTQTDEPNDLVFKQYILRGFTTEVLYQGQL